MDLLEMTFDQRTEYYTGILILSIAKGEFKEAVYSTIAAVAEEAYNRGVKQGRKVESLKH